MDRTGQVGVITRARKWSIGWWVAVVSRSRAHHVVIATSPTTCISAEPGGVRTRPITQYGDRITWTRYDLTLAEATNIRWFAEGHIGIDYNVSAFLVLAAHYTTRLPIPAWVADRVDNRDAVTCSQLAADILKALNIHPIPTARIVSPADWWDLATTQGWATTT